MRLRYSSSLLTIMSPRPPPGDIKRATWQTFAARSTKSGKQERAPGGQGRRSAAQAAHAVARVKGGGDRRRSRRSHGRFVLAQAGVSVELFDRMPSPARKFLMAGRGGLNLTHSEPLERFLARYGSAAGRLAPAIRAFPPDALRAFAEGLGEETFVGSSGRVSRRASRLRPCCGPGCGTSPRRA